MMKGNKGSGWRDEGWCWIPSPVFLDRRFLKMSQIGAHTSSKQRKTNWKRRRQFCKYLPRRITDRATLQVAPTDSDQAFIVNLTGSANSWWSASEGLLWQDHDTSLKVWILCREKNPGEGNVVVLLAEIAASIRSSIDFIGVEYHWQIQLYCVSS